ncbi:MAG TPA: AAA-like domain-containing protein [Candidatus Kapabacteria bacterium]|nr:AAA-like domain-containing protein [Candidatus Kapabacteria bacterium]
MRKFSSYGPIDTEMDYYAPRKELIEKTYIQLIGENPRKGGHYFTVWAPRQTGKTWIMQETLFQLEKDPRFHTLKINLEILKDEEDTGEIINVIARKIGEGLGKKISDIKNKDQFQEIFKKDILDKPLILILDEFDALSEKGINTIVSAFRNIYISRTDEKSKTTEQKTYLLHAVALIGVRSVLGIENEKGSPFNIQRSVHISNLTHEEVEGMFKWYERESGQAVEEEVTRTLFDELRGQPGLTCWFGELLTETYNPDPKKPISMSNFDEAYGAATHILPNNNILNLISKVDKPPYDETVIKFFETDDKTVFNYDDKNLNYLYMNGIITEEKVGPKEYYVKFSCPFVQKRIFSYFSRRFFSYLGQLIHPLDDLEDAVDEENLYLPNIIKRYQAYLTKNQGVFFKDVPRRKTDMKIYEAIFHFNLFRYLFDLLKKRGVEVIPEFPTGNGKIDLILKYRKNTYALELKSFSDMSDLRQGIEPAANYGSQTGLKEISFVVFIELSPSEAKQLEKEVEKNGIKVTVLPVGIL